MTALRVLDTRIILAAFLVQFHSLCTSDGVSPVDCFSYSVICVG